MYGRLADLPVRIEEYDLERRERETSSDFTRVTTTVTLRGDGHAGRGEDVTYDADEHDALFRAADFDLAGAYTIDSASAMFDGVDLFPAGDPEQGRYRRYRRWAFESAVLDLALRQAGTDLGGILDREYDPVRFVVSTRLGDPPTADRVRDWLDIDPGIAFKLDATPAWTPALIDELAATGAVEVLDLKAQYEDTDVDADPDADLYRRLVEAFPDAVIEDPGVTDQTRPVLADAAERLAWDVPIESADDIRDRPWEPRWCNVKPSRFGTVERLFDALAYCFEHDIALYGGGQFELGVGREQLHALASLFYPGAPNDVAPRGYNDPEPRTDLPSSPLAPPDDVVGFRWRGGA